MAAISTTATALPRYNGTLYFTRRDGSREPISSLIKTICLLPLVRLHDRIHAYPRRTHLWIILYTFSVIRKIARHLRLFQRSGQLRDPVSTGRLFQIPTFDQVETEVFANMSPSNVQRRFHTFKRVATSSVIVACLRAADRMAIALVPDIRFANLDFNGPTVSHAAATTDTTVGEDQHGDTDGCEEPTRTFPNNEHLFRYFESLPTDKDPGFQDSLWSVRLSVAAYPPSTGENMRPIQLGDLRLGGRNFGKSLLVKAILAPKHMEALHVLIEDEAGEWGYLHVFNFPYTQHPDDRVCAGQLLVLKEPYYYTGYDGVPAIRVDHPSDIVYIMQDHPLMPERFQRNDAHGPGVLPKLMRWDGEVRMRWRKYHQAIEFLSLGVDGCNEKDVGDSMTREELALFKRELLQLRVCALFYVGFYDKCIQDATALMVDKFDERAAWFMANCYLKLRNYDGAKKLILLLMQHNTKFKFKECSKVLLQIRNNISQIQGFYNMENLVDRCKKGEELQAGDYVKDIRIKRSRVHGYGLFTDKSVKAGDIIFAARAFATVSGTDNNAVDIRDENGGLVKRRYGQKLVSKVLERMNCEPKAAPLICRICGSKGPGYALKDVDGRILVDGFYIDEIVERDALQHGMLPRHMPAKCAAIDPDLFPPTPSPTTGSSGKKDTPADDGTRTHTSFWITNSFINHSCVPNACRSIIGDMMFLIATADMRIGAEVFINYMGDDYEPRSGRRQHIKDKFGFACCCRRCKFEIGHRAYCEAQQRIPDTIRDIIAGQVTSNTLLQLAGVRTCLEVLKKNWQDHPLYDLPRFDLVYCLMAEEYVHGQIRPWGAVEGGNHDGSDYEYTDEEEIAKAYHNMRFAMRVIRALGGEYFITEEDFWMVRPGFVCKWLVEAYFLAAASCARFYGTAFWSLKIASGNVYAMLFGERATFEEVFWERVGVEVSELTEEDMRPVGEMREMLEGYGLHRSELG
ncbi:hypothetical protein DRE_01005 [Drechslerella stenobrocha 248]|uniref:SET domain-containing protein n=1 Tax=Drechslerella stenobrocha 248 TaxID=1043628 RepID=W7HLR3_9PEZI|nr:hypothetical protein DRE_01005 [Drechslerella stenobrocha 248]